MADLPIMDFADEQAWEAWLESHHKGGEKSPPLTPPRFAERGIKSGTD